MTTEAIHIAGEHEDRPVKIPVGHAAKWLLGNKTGTDGYNRVSVRLYDFADTDDLACKTTESDRVTFADLGRMTCLAASLRYDRAHLLMELSQEIDWPEQLPRLEDLPSSERADDFIVHDGVARGHALFRAFKDHTGLGSGTVSKLLHLKWPAFYPSPTPSSSRHTGAAPPASTALAGTLRGPPLRMATSVPIGSRSVAISLATTRLSGRCRKRSHSGPAVMSTLRRMPTDSGSWSR